MSPFCIRMKGLAVPCSICPPEDGSRSRPSFSGRTAQSCGGSQGEDSHRAQTVLPRSGLSCLPLLELRSLPLAGFLRTPRPRWQKPSCQTEGESAEGTTRPNGSGSCEVRGADHSDAVKFGGKRTTSTPCRMRPACCRALPCHPARANASGPPHTLTFPPTAAPLAPTLLQISARF